ncbi:hypothetical protein PanWU01x14_339900, partial [Parasponia andersonii]
MERNMRRRKKKKCTDMGGLGFVERVREVSMVFPVQVRFIFCPASIILLGGSKKKVVGIGMKRDNDQN